ncbi:E3 ubiquitin-protein ligase Mdm2-like isoform X5 [Monodelphis domestica]|uniref:E3 ubiquitin-protein ligase Mdm2-like isoform X5 n=1 Tax=Monodelphis domestica TaxID=13616 RepID=UPI0024E23949|nr:E3 ubiquitin-protein ligase Mdm2-like isoform X5 [Monodelphis domestica]
MEAAGAELVQGTSRDSLVSELGLRGGLLPGETEAELSRASLRVLPSSQPSSCVPPQFRPQTLFLRVLRDGGACEDVFTYGQILFYLGEYIKTKGLFDKEQEHVVCCSNDLLGDVFGASSFSMREHRKLSAMIYRNLIAVDPSESISPPELRELESKHKKSVRGLWEEQPSSTVDTRPSTTSGRRSPREREDNMEELPCGQPRSQQKSESSLSLPLGGCGVLSGIWPGEPRESSLRHTGFITSTMESEQEPWEEHPSPNMGTERSSSSRRPSSETDEDVEKLPYGQSGNLEKSESEGSISHSIGGCSVRSDVASVQSSGHPSVITTPSSPDNSADAISDQFSVEYEVESMESEDYSPNEEGEELGPALAVQGSQKLAVQEKGTPSLLPQPSTAHDQTGGKPGPGSYSQPPPVRENNPRAVSAMSSYRGLGDSHSSSWRAPSSSLSITEPCIICLSHPKNGCIVHGITGHLVTCYTCARRLQRRDKPCPVCRQPIHLTVLVYLT